MYNITSGLVNIPRGHYVTLQTALDWNSLPRETLQAESLATFKSKVATLIHDLPYKTVYPQILLLSLTVINTFYLCSYYTNLLPFVLFVLTHAAYKLLHRRNVQYLKPVCIYDYHTIGSCKPPI